MLQQLAYYSLYFFFIFMQKIPGFIAKIHIFRFWPENILKLYEKFCDITSCNTVSNVKSVYEILDPMLDDFSFTNNM